MKEFVVKDLSMNSEKKGRYLMDYSRKYGNPYHVEEKARKHMLSLDSQKRESKTKINMC